MIWGEVINSVRSLHRDFVEEFSVDPKAFTRDLEWPDAGLPFPVGLDDFDEWEEPELAPELTDLLPLHPVERSLVEGPLLPIQKIRFTGKDEIDRLFGSILNLEKHWFQQTGNSTPDRIQYLENFLAVQALKLSVRAGFGRIASVKGT
jgi:hypothetical protein